ncbi:hypothetical protein [Bacillus sp. AK128]
MTSLLFGAVAGVLTFIFAGELSELFITNILLGIIAGRLMDKR